MLTRYCSSISLRGADTYGPRYRKLLGMAATTAHQSSPYCRDALRQIGVGCAQHCGDGTTVMLNLDCRSACNSFTSYITDFQLDGSLGGTILGMMAPASRNAFVRSCFS